MSGIQKRSSYSSFQSKSEKIVDVLESTMAQIIKKDVTADNVKAACSCADKIIQIMRLNFEAHKFASLHIHDALNSDE